MADKEEEVTLNDVIEELTRCFFVSNGLEFAQDEYVIIHDGFNYYLKHHGKNEFKLKDMVEELATFLEKFTGQKRPQEIKTLLAVMEINALQKGDEEKVRELNSVIKSTLENR